MVPEISADPHPFLETRGSFTGDYSMNRTRRLS
jgi:hypothetical protein